MALAILTPTYCGSGIWAKTTCFCYISSISWPQKLFSIFKTYMQSGHMTSFGDFQSQSIP
jgi:hypothetical protein